MANIQLFGPIKVTDVLAPGQSTVISTSILVPVPPENGNLAFVVTARPSRTAPAVFAVSVRDVTVVNNNPPGGINLNFTVVNTHATQALSEALITIAAIS